MLVHGYALSLELMGIAPLGPAVELSFGDLNHSLTHATTALGRTGRLEKTELGAVEVIKQDYGVWAVQGYHMHIEDLALVDGSNVRQAWRGGIEAIGHYFIINNYTGACFLNPEVVFMTPEEKRDPHIFLERLRQPPFQLVLDTSSRSHQNIRLLKIKATAAALDSNYNTKDDLVRAIAAVQA